MIIDTTQVLKEIEDIFSQVTDKAEVKNLQPPPSIDTPIVLTALQRMQHALHEYRRPQSPTPTILEKSDCKAMNVRLESTSHFKAHMLLSLKTCARLMMFCEEFTTLPKEDKVRHFCSQLAQMTIIKYAWTSLLQIERVHQTIILFGPILHDRRIMLFNFSEVSFSVNIPRGHRL